MATGSSNLDLVFAMDCTGSMSSYIQSATDNIGLIIDGIVSKEMVTVRLALIEYRDHPPQDTTFVTRVHSFTNTVAEMKGWLGLCTAEGGGDGPEAVADALNDALNLPWRSDAVKICILISDAPPHGLVPDGDSFPSGCPAGHDPLAIVRKMGEKKITLYTVGVEPPIVPYRDFFMTIAGLTSGQYVPMADAARLTEMIISGVREEISIVTLVRSSKDDIVREMRQAAIENVDDTETAKRLQRVFTNKKKYVNRMKNDAGTPSREVEECYSKCFDMSDMQKKYKKVDKVPTTTTAETSYKLEENTTVSLDQAKRIVQKAKNWNYGADQESESCKYGAKCYDHTSHHRKKFSHPESDHSTIRSTHSTTRSTHETQRNNHTSATTSSRRNDFHHDTGSHREECKYGAKCRDNTSHHQTRFSHPDSDHLTTTSADHSTVKNEKSACRYGVHCEDHTSHHRTRFSHPDNDHLTTTSSDHSTVKNEKSACRHGVDCEDHTSHHRTKYSHPESDEPGSRWSHQRTSHGDTTRNQDKSECRYGVNCEDHTSHHRSRYSHPEKDDSGSRWSHQKTNTTATNNNRPSCKYGGNCYDHSSQHRTKFSHPSS